MLNADVNTLMTEYMIDDDDDDNDDNQQWHEMEICVFISIAQIYNQQFSKISYNNIVIPTRLCLVDFNHSKVALCIQYSLRH